MFQMPLHVSASTKTTNCCNGHKLSNCFCSEDECTETSSSADTSCTFEFFDESSCKSNDSDCKKRIAEKSKRSNKERRKTRCKSPTQVIAYCTY